jgi:hypothetical protein
LILPSEWLPVIWGGEEQFALNHNASRLSNSSQRVLSDTAPAWDRSSP